ncbi:phage protease [Candidatus Tokpelaia sp.]|uniref:phage protease n=1 Tax=Candidatus Tokpelaia sp. TaxID=2233777 RepID=UPI00123B3E83|nr:phage protease [Candidatus Tokpelaia sp.]KAA6405661.1 hypothetical protein DPQ22_03085 [Candidatus Tokpelaia sp.]
MTENLATCCFMQPLPAPAEAGTAPKWVQIFPKGPHIKARDGREWELDANAVIAAFTANQGPLAVDYEHAQDILPEIGEKAPASGWIEELQTRDDGLYARIEWTAEAARAIAAREYRYISPSFSHLKNGYITKLIGAGLVNRPAFIMHALARRQQQQKQKQEHEMSLQAIAASLGLKEDAIEKDIIAAIAGQKSDREKERQALCSAMAVKSDSDMPTIIKAVEAQKLAAAEAVAKSKQSEGEQTALAALQTQFAEGQKELAELRGQMRDKDVDSFLDGAIAAGKMTPAARAEYKALCNTQEGFDGCKKLVEKLPALAKASNLDGKQAGTAEAGDTADPQKVAHCAVAYQNEQAAKGIAISTIDAVDFIMANPDRLK